MSLLTDIIPFSMADNKRGITVERNISSLSAQLEIGAGTISLKDGTANDIFGANDVIIGAEDVLVGAGDNITRAQNGTADILHRLGATVRLLGGATIATFSFTGSESVTGIRAECNGPASFQLTFDGLYTPMMHTGGLGQSVFFPFSGIQPDAGAVVIVLGWTNLLSADFWAWCHR
ncbi:MAG: hypothetical protein FVQ81_02045 [Candidatus Glassbacteria bacterium]|nr:hypothetical protein [Candidatus Glassbacteria bacterium]